MVIEHIIVLLTALVLLAVYIYLAVKKPGVAVLSCLPVSLAIGIFAANVESVAAVLVAVCFMPVILIVILLPARPPDEDQWYRSAAKGLLVTIVLVVITLGLSAIHEVLGALGVAVVFLFVWSSVFLAMGSRFSTAAYVFSTLGYCMRQNLPLPMALDSTAGRNDAHSRTLLRIRKWLLQGYSLVEAIKRGYPACPGDALATVAAAEQINQLPQAIKSIEANMVARANGRRRIRPVPPAYPLVLISLMFFILLAVMKWVIPRLHEVLSEMFEGEPFPLVSRVVMNIASFIAYQYGWLIGLIGAIAFFVIVPYAIRVRFRPRQAQKPYLISRIGDFVKWHLPVFHWFENSYSMTQAVQMLRLSLNSGCTVNQSIANTLSVDLNNCFRKRLGRWLAKVEAGDSIADSARRCGLGMGLAWAFSQNANQNSTLSVLETLESFYRTNYSYAVNLARFIFWPCVSITLGIMVGFVVYAIFSPIVVIITKLAAAATP